MTVKFPYFAGDVQRLLDLLLWIEQLGGCKGHSALLVADAGVDYRIALQAKTMALRSFDRCEIVNTNESVMGWPGGPNNLFLTALMHDLPHGGPWLWMETDAVPLHRDWVSIIQQELSANPALVRFYDCTQPGLPPKVASGIAAYNQGPLIEKVRDAVQAEMYKPFDMVINHLMLSQATNTARIQHVWGEKDIPPTFNDSVMPRPRGFMTLAQIEPGVVLFHRNKDGSLIKLLRERTDLSSNISQTRKSCSTGVAVVIPIYRPSNEMLSRCLECVLPQVDEIIVTRQGDGIVPEGLLTHEKIRHVVTPELDIGFGKNVNFGMTHTTKDHVLILNDDVYLAPDAVSKMMEVMKPGVGIVGHLNRYPDGTIHHGGKLMLHQLNGQHPHVDYRKRETSIKQPVEMENTNAASMLVNRNAFFKIGGFDERFKFFCEDDDLCLRMRQNGWAVWYTPFATGIHDGHQETSRRPDLETIKQESNRLYLNLWGWYYNLNKGRSGLGIFKKKCETSIVYIYPLAGASGWREKAVQFVNSYNKNPPGMEHDTIIVCNGAPADSDAQTVFGSMKNVTFLNHDNSGWDIGGYQTASRKSESGMMAFFGAHTYFRNPGWLARMCDAFEQLGDTLYGCTGNQGNMHIGVHPHIRTTAFWCSPSLFNRYPHIVTTTGGGGQRYEMEHGKTCITNWVVRQGKIPWVVGWEFAFPVSSCDSMPEGYHKGNQSSVMVGDRMTAPPYHPVP
jgi:GT2 family glycosyltransferase